MALIGAAALLPLNIWLSGQFFQIFPEPVWLLRVLRRLLIGVLLFCTEEILMASAARFLWKKQHQLQKHFLPDHQD